MMVRDRDGDPFLASKLALGSDLQSKYQMPGKNGLRPTIEPFWAAGLTHTITITYLVHTEYSGTSSAKLNSSSLISHGSPDHLNYCLPKYNEYPHHCVILQTD